MIPENDKIKRAVVLGGGGSRGAYQVGCWRAMEEAGMDYHVVTGTSVGALNGGMMVQRRLDDAWKIWSGLDVSRILTDMPDPDDTLKTLQTFAGRFIKEGGADFGPLETLAKQVMDEDRIRASGIDYGIVTVDLTTRKPVELLLGEMPQGSVADYMLASATCFPAFRPKELDGSLYIDGGYYDNLPVNLALRSRVAVDEVWAVNVEGPGLIRKPETALPVHTVRCHWDLGNFLSFDNALINRDMALGYNDMRRRLGTLDGVNYSFQKGEAAFLEVCCADRLLAMMTTQKSLNLLREALQGFAEERLAGLMQERAGSAALNRGDAVLAAAEWAGEALDVDPEPVYTLEAFNRALTARTAALRDSGPGDMLEELRSGGVLPLVGRLKSMASGAQVLLARELLRRTAAREIPAAAEALCLALPKTYLAALYLFLIEPETALS